MAWQNSAAMGGNGGVAGGAGDGGSNGGQPQGTEYTLQGTKGDGFNMLLDPPQSALVAEVAVMLTIHLVQA